VLAALVAACGKSAPAPQTEPPVTAPVSVAGSSPGAVDAGDDTDAEPLETVDILQGAQAVKEIAILNPGEVKAEPALATASLTITPVGVGPFRLGMTRAEVIAVAGDPSVLGPTYGNPEQPEATGALWSRGAPLLQFHMFAGRLSEITVVARDERASTDREIFVGSTLQQAIDGHGDPRAIVDPRTGKPRGWVLEDLPGVIFVAAGVPTDELAPVLVTRIIVVGPESD
jgi:hypothetical protein